MSYINNVFDDVVDSIVDELKYSSDFSIQDIIKYIDEEVSKYKYCYSKYKKLLLDCPNDESYSFYERLCFTFYNLVIRFEHLSNFIKSNL